MGLDMNHYEPLERYADNQNIPWKKNASLKELCTFKIGGDADRIFYPASEAEIAGLLSAASQVGIPLMVLGKGSNLLFSDTGYSGAILLMGSVFAKIRMLDDVTLECESGAPLSALCRFAQERGLSGLEFAYGIPGSVGGAVYMNAGAYGGEMKDVLFRVHHLDREGNSGSLSASNLNLSYRHSAYTENGYVITKAVVRLAPGDPQAVRARMEEYMQRRRDKQPLDSPSAGSVFRRPTGAYASALIDECGLKGRQVGGAMVSTKHAGFIINSGGATCRDVLALIEIIQDEVNRQTGYKLECEIKIAE